jgi:hypothetical protein
MSENTCYLTKEQIKKLQNGESIIIEFRSLEDYGFVSRHDIEIFPVIDSVRKDSCYTDNVLNADSRGMK